MSNVLVRTITLGIDHPHPIPATVIERASGMLQRASELYQEAGYGVQTVRLSTRNLFDDLVGWEDAAIVAYGKELQQIVAAHGLGFCSLGTIQAARRNFPLERIDLLADLLIGGEALNATVQLATVEHGLRSEAALPVAQLMQRLARETEEGFGNFRFGALACVEPGTPFFPAAYHDGPMSLSIGLQGAGIVMRALAAADRDHGALAPEQITQLVRDALIKEATPVVELGRRAAQQEGVKFGGIDLSPAPLGDDSIAEAIELCGYGPLGEAGTLTVVAALTAALKSTELPTCGYCGVMLPVLEDSGLGRRWEEERVNVQQLLLYSTVCGTGLDTIPLPGDVSTESIAHILLDVAALALRLRKPLSARLFPVPGKRAGERTVFTSPYLTNTLVRA